MLSELLSKVPDGDLFVLFIILAGIAAGVLIALTGIVSSQWRKYRQFQTEVAFKEAMVGRGLSVPEIEGILRATANPALRDHAVTIDADSVDVVVEQDGEWYPASVLKRSGEVLFIHYDGYDSSDDEWVPISRVRFRARPLGAPSTIESASAAS